MRWTITTAALAAMLCCGVIAAEQSALPPLPAFRVYSVSKTTREDTVPQSTGRKLEHVKTHMVCLTLHTAHGLQNYEAYAEDLPIALMVRPGDSVRPGFVPMNNNKLGLGSLEILDSKGDVCMPEEHGKISTWIKTIEMDKTRKNVKLVGCADGKTYAIDISRHSWHEKLRTGMIVRFGFIEKDGDRWVHKAKGNGANEDFRDKWCDPVIVTAMEWTQDKRRVLIKTNHADIEYYVDTGEAPDVKYQRLGEPPRFSYRILLPCSGLAVLQPPQPARAGPGGNSGGGGGGGGGGNSSPATVTVNVTNESNVNNTNQSANTNTNTNQSTNTNTVNGGQ